MAKRYCRIMVCRFLWPFDLLLTRFRFQVWPTSTPKSLDTVSSIAGRHPKPSIPLLSRNLGPHVSPILLLISQAISTRLVWLSSSSLLERCHSTTSTVKRPSMHDLSAVSDRLVQHPSVNPCGPSPNAVGLSLPLPA